MIPFALAATFARPDPIIGRWTGGVVIVRPADTARARSIQSRIAAERFVLNAAEDGTFRIERAGKTIRGQWRRKASAYLLIYPDPNNPTGKTEQSYVFRDGRLVHLPDPKSRPSGRIVFHRS